MNLLNDFSVNKEIKLYFILIITVALGFLQSCKKDRSQFVIASDKDAISMAHENFDKELLGNQAQSFSNSLLPDNLLKLRKPLWANAYTQSNGDTVVVFVPIELPNVNLTLKSGGVAGTSLNNLLFLRLIDTGKGFIGSKAEMIALLPDQEWKQGEHFSGNMMIENWFKPNLFYVRLSKKPVELVVNEANKGSGNTIVMGFPTCTQTDLTACVVVGSFTNCTTTSTVSCQGGGDGGGSGGGSGGGINVPSNPGAGGSGGGNSSQGDILKDSLTRKFPCVTKLVLNKLETIIAYNQMIEPFILAGSKPNIIWNAAEQPWTNSSLSGGTTQITSGSSTGMSSSITLNSKMIQNASQLLITAVTIHETYHAYINYLFGNKQLPDLFNQSQPSFMAGFYAYTNFVADGGNNYNDHYIMLTSQFDTFTSILYTYGGGSYSLDDCRKALLFGMNNPGANPSFYASTFIAQAYNDILTKYGYTANDINTFNLAQINAASGSKLPTGCH